jgi:hypothetical protein
MGEEGQGRGGKQGDEAECEWVKSTWVGCPGWIRSWSWQSWRPRRRRRGRGRASPGTCGHGEWRFLRARGLVRRHRRRRRRRGSGQWWRLEDLLHPIPFWLSSTSGLRVGCGGGGDGEVPCCSVACQRKLLGRPRGESPGMGVGLNWRELWVTSLSSLLYSTYGVFSRNDSVSLLQTSKKNLRDFPSYRIFDAFMKH